MVELLHKPASEPGEVSQSTEVLSWLHRRRGHTVHDGLLDLGWEMELEVLLCTAVDVLPLLKPEILI